MQITHKKIPNENDKVGLADWTDTHDIDLSGTFQFKELVEKKVITTTVNQVDFSGLDGLTDLNYVLEGVLITNDDCDSLNIGYNDDALSGAYYQYLQLQESDGEGHHLRNWNENRTAIRIMAGTVKFKVELSVIDGYGVLSWSTFSFSSFGGGEGFQRYKPASFSNITKLNLFGTASKKFKGIVSLYKIVDIEI